MRRKLKNPKITTSVRITPEFHKLAYENDIPFGEALAVGISVMLAEMGVQDYDNRLNIYRKMLLYQKQLQEVTEELLQIKSKHRKIEDDTA